MSTRIYNPAIRAPRLWAFGVWLRGTIQSGGFLFAVWMVVIAVTIQVLNYLIGFLQRDWSTILFVVPLALAALGIVTSLVSQRKPLHERYPDLVADASELRGYAVQPKTPNEKLWEAVQHIRASLKLVDELDGYLKDARPSKRIKDRMSQIADLAPGHVRAAQSALSLGNPSFSIPE